MAKRILLGDRATGGLGLFVSKSGSNVETCNTEDLIFSTSLPNTIVGGPQSSYGQTLIQYQTGSVSPTTAKDWNTEHGELLENDSWYEGTAAYTPITNELGNNAPLFVVASMVNGSNRQIKTKWRTYWNWASGLWDDSNSWVDDGFDVTWTSTTITFATKVNTKTIYYKLFYTPLEDY